MKILIFVIICLFMSSLPKISAETAKDSFISIIAKWNNRETHLFEYTEQKQIINSSDTLTTYNRSHKFTIEVNDSSEHFYLLKYRGIIDTTSQTHFALDSVHLKLITNKNGALIKILNWEDYMPIYNYDNRALSDALLPFASLISYNGKNLRLNYKYRGAEIISGTKIKIPADSVIAHTEMTATQDFSINDVDDLITINTIVKYTYCENLASINITDYFTQIIDSSNAWPLATYFVREFTSDTTSIIERKIIQLID